MKAEEILAVTGHRPWPLRKGPWLMWQEWDRLLFAHWEVDAEKMRALVPGSLGLELFGGKCYVAVTPFRVMRLHARGVPPLPGFSSFPELNVRTYVTFDGKPGVYFFSLDAGALSAVLGARSAYALPYFYARMRMKTEGVAVNYFCCRTYTTPRQAKRRDEPQYASVKTAEFQGRYWPAGPVQEAAPGTLERFLVERYCLYAAEGRRLYRAEIHHVPWPLQPAAAKINVNTMAEAAEIELVGAPLLHFAEHIEVLVWGPERLK